MLERYELASQRGNRAAGETSSASPAEAEIVTVTVVGPVVVDPVVVDLVVVGPVVVDLVVAEIVTVTVTVDAGAGRTWHLSRCRKRRSARTGWSGLARTLLPRLAGE
jgi:hypothetical protein